MIDILVSSRGDVISLMHDPNMWIAFVNAIEPVPPFLVKWSVRKGVKMLPRLPIRDCDQGRATTSIAQRHTRGFADTCVNALETCRR